MFLPVLVLINCLNFPVNDFNEYGLYGAKYEYDNTVFYSDSSSVDSVSDNNSDIPDDEYTFQGVTEENFNEFKGDFREYISQVETHNIEIDTRLQLISEFLKYITAFGLFLILCLLLKYIYKLFNIFF